MPLQPTHTSAPVHPCAWPTAQSQPRRSSRRRSRHPRTWRSCASSQSSTQSGGWCVCVRARACTSHNASSSSNSDSGTGRSSTSSLDGRARNLHARPICPPRARARARTHAASTQQVPATPAPVPARTRGVSLQLTRPVFAPPSPAPPRPRRTGTFFCSDKSVTAVVIQGLAEHKDTLGAPLCPCRHYDDKPAEASQGYWNCPCVPMRERKVRGLGGPARL